MSETIQICMITYWVHINGRVCLCLSPFKMPSTAGTDVVDTSALPHIWQESERFRQAVDEFRVAAKALTDAAGSGDRSRTMRSFKVSGNAGKSCEERFKRGDD